jgi:hypothetical protein
MPPFSGEIYQVMLLREEFTFQLYTVHLSALNSSLFNFK